MPGIIVGNDWFTGFMPAYVKYGHFGDYFQHTTMFHIIHNLGTHYEGRIYPDTDHAEVSL
jgi:starch synthase